MTMKRVAICLLIYYGQIMPMYFLTLGIPFMVPLFILLCIGIASYQMGQLGWWLFGIER